MITNHKYQSRGRFAKGERMNVIISRRGFPLIAVRASLDSISNYRKIGYGVKPLPKKKRKALTNG